ncbi:alpha-galactosidase A [Microthyrium microscopicum]|uniref:Alpha-galactosidase A n=1 Tax=Microthyrium microscopicum TaxID=703497 RepID=A0A6A6TZQ1_9PEZI|nr:alpha-galactosidase A [Microthyrium microscopicum]
MESLTVAKSEISVLNQEIDNEKGFYRIRAGNRVHYVTIFAGVFDETIMCRPFLLVPVLPDFPDDQWTTMEIRPQKDGTVETTISSEPLPTIEDDIIWHANKVEILDLKASRRRIKPRILEVMYEDTPAIAKFARFPWEIAYVENETFAYSVLQEHAPEVIPRFLGHLTEGGRVMGLLLEKVEGACVSIENLSQCEKAVQAIHQAGLLHGDVNRYNFIVDSKTAAIKVIDFEHAEAFEHDLAKKEMDSLIYEIQEDSGRGGPPRLIAM